MEKQHRNRSSLVRLTTILALASHSSFGEAPGSIGRVALMPSLPQPYEMRDWQQVTSDYIGSVFDWERQGQHLPLMRWEDESRSMIWMPSFVGHPRGPEGINYLAAVVSGSLAGMDMRNYRGHDWVAIGTNFFSPEDGVFLNWPRGRTESGGSSWYDVFPNVLFFQLADLYPEDKAATDLMRNVAGRWNEALAAMGSGANEGALPDFDHTGFNLRTMQPFDNGTRVEPEGGAGIAWLQYMAWNRFKDGRFLLDATHAIRALEQKRPEANPLYEVLLPYAAMTAARMNAELEHEHDVRKLLNWCFDPRPKPQARPNWGVITGSWNGKDVGGLVGSTTDGGGYAFAMNTFHYVGVLAPLSRYDDRYAHDLGKWILNAANASRLFYANAHDAEHQSSHAWAWQNDPKSAIAYEGLRKWKRGSSATVVADHQTAAGTVTRGSFRSTHYYQEIPVDTHVLVEGPAGEGARLDHIWELELPKDSQRYLVVATDQVDAARAGNRFQFSYASHPAGPYTEAFAVYQSGQKRYAAIPDSLRGRLFVRVKSTDASFGRAGSIAVDAVAVAYQTKAGPYAQGDLVVSFVGLEKNSTVPIVLYRPSDTATDLGLYGSSHVGYLGGLIRPTSVEKILQLDLLKTDFFRAPAYPTFLYYNPYSARKAVDIQVGETAVDLYDSVANTFLARGVRGKTRLPLPSDSARVIVLCPAGGRLERQGFRTLVNEVVVDYRN